MKKEEMQGEEINRVLWLMTGIASLSLAVMAFGAPHPPRVVDFGWLTAAVVFVDGWRVPFVFLRGTETAGKRIVASGANLLFACAGISAYPDDAREKDAIIGHADDALSQAKQVGRNQIFCHRAGSAAAEAAPAPEES